MSNSFILTDGAQLTCDSGFDNNIINKLKKDLMTEHQNIGRDLPDFQIEVN